MKPMLLHYPGKYTHKTSQKYSEEELRVILIIKHMLITLRMAQEYTKISMAEDEFRNRPKYIRKLA